MDFVNLPHMRSLFHDQVQKRFAIFKTLGVVLFCHPWLDMQLFLSPERPRESFMPLQSSEYNFSQDLYFAFFFAVVLVFSSPILSKVIHTQDARHRLLKTEQDKLKQGEKHVFWGLFLRGSFATGRMNIG